LVSVTLNIIVGVLLIPVVGAVGVAFGTLASFTMLSLVNFITFQRYWVKIKYFNNRTG
jgi:peptidoglycan biosynthesis protein MviN/MurJ (putative lipid II flippase)